MKFYKYFIITIVVLFVVYFAALFKVNQKLNSIDIKTEYNNYKAINFLKELRLILPKELSDLDNKYILDNSLKMKKEIAESIDKVYEDVYKQIPIFIDQHYTVTGEYAELYAILIGDIGSKLTKILYTDSDFNNKIEKSVQSIIDLNMFNLNQKISEMNKNVYSKLKDEFKDNTAIYNNVVNIIKVDTLGRYKNDALDLVRYSGTITTAGIAVMSKTIAKKITLKIMAKSSTKVLLKYGAGGVGAGTGATIGSIIPGWGTAIGGVIGGLVGWFGTDKLIIEVDEYLNRDKFEKQLKKLLIRQQQKFEDNIYLQIVEMVKKDIKANIDLYKGISIKDILQK